jgi:caffeoyl-CoA O-methyltransferase
MDFTWTPEIDQYAESHSSAEPELLARLNRETHLRTHMPQMISGNTQGTLLRMISGMMKPMKILEIGTFTGYSAICLASGLQEDGVLHTIEINPEMEDFAMKYFREAGMEHKIHMHIGAALEIIPTIEGPFDLVFIDADKENYTRYLELVLDNLSKDGLILADNTLWYGRVIRPDAEKDRETAGIIEFNNYVQSCPGVENLLLPLRDGITMIRRIDQNRFIPKRK